MGKQEILSEIKRLVLLQEPTAEIILYGSYARGSSRPDSDIDLLILLDKEKITHDDEKRISYPLYDIEFKTGQLISPMIKSRKEWFSKYKVTPFFKNVTGEGVIL